MNLNKFKELANVFIPKEENEGEERIDTGRIKPEDIGVEMLFTSSDRKGNLHIQDTCQFVFDHMEDNVAVYVTSVLPQRTGMYQVATRVYPKNADLPHRQDFPLVKWL